MANTVKAYKNYNGNIVIDCGILYGKRVQYVVTDNAVVRVEEDLIITDFSNMEEQYFDNMILATLDNAILYAKKGRALSIPEIEALMVLVNEKAEDFDGPGE